MKEEEKYSSCGNCVRYLLIIGNLTFLIAGSVTIGIAVYISVYKWAFIATVFGTSIIAACSYLMVVAGCLVFIVAFIGCFGGLLRNRILLLTYIIVLFFVICSAISSIVSAVVFRNWLSNEVRYHMQTSLLHDYGVNLQNERNRMVTDSWDNAQTLWHCCSVDDQSWGIYHTSDWYKENIPGENGIKPLVPESCCGTTANGSYANVEKCQTYMSGPPGMTGQGLSNEALYYRGCFDAGVDSIHYWSTYLIALGILITTLVTFGVIFAIILFVAITKGYSI